MERFYEDAKRLYGMPRMMDADEDALRDELGVLVYLAELMDSLPSMVADSNTVAMEALSLDFPDDDDAVRGIIITDHYFVIIAHTTENVVQIFLDLSLSTLPLPLPLS